MTPSRKELTPQNTYCPLMILTPISWGKYVPVVQQCLFNVSDVSHSILHALSLYTSLLFNLQEE